MISSPATKAKKQRSNKNDAKRKSVGSTRLHDWFIVIFGTAFLLSFSLNVIQFRGTNDDGYAAYGTRGGDEQKLKNKDATRAALHRTIKDFKRSSFDKQSSSKKKRINQPPPSTTTKDDEKKLEEKSAVVEADQLMTLGTLDCSAYGGLSPNVAKDMVYWQDISSDASYVSPFFEADSQKEGKGGKKYLTFEPDGGGWNNIRMAMESTIMLAIAMGRTLVMPPQKKMYLLGKNQGGQRHHFSFVDFFPIEEMAEENKAFNVISMKEYLEEEAMKGNLINRETGKVEFPPGNRTDWDGINQQDYDTLREYLRNVSHTLRWKPGECLPAFPSSGNHKDVEILQQLVKKAKDHGRHKAEEDLFRVDDPNPLSRLEDSLAGRSNLCVYDEQDQKEQTVHFQTNHKERLRLLVHFYAFLFFEDWREDLWMKRFVRDHLHYTDEIQCAAGRVVDKVRRHVSKRTDGKSTAFDTFHVRRGDFQYKETRIEIEEIIKNTKEHLTPNSTIFIATDERDKKYFEPMKKMYDLLFLDDFTKELVGVNSNYYGMIDQLVASQGRLFFGCWKSTFTGYIMRMRGYHSIKNKAPGYERGELPTSYYYVTKDRYKEMHKYASLRPGYFIREYPTSWRDIDKGIKKLLYNG